MMIQCPSCQGQLQVPAPPPPPPQLSINRPAAPATQTAPPSLAAQAAAAEADFSNAAPLGKRVIAKVLDYVFQIAIIAAISIGWRFAIVSLARAGTNRETLAVAGTAVLALVLLIPFLYNYLPLANSGATWGKNMLGLAVVRQNGQRLGYAWALLRVAAEYICVGVCYGIALAIFIGAVRAQMHGTGPQPFTPPPMPQPGQPFHPPVMASHNNGPLKMLLTLPVFLLMLAPYLPAIFTKGRRATHDFIAQTLVVSQ
jgi:uncharacterized RDD family membrane protein YckC